MTAKSRAQASASKISQLHCTTTTSSAAPLLDLVVVSRWHAPLPLDPIYLWIPAASPSSSPSCSPSSPPRPPPTRSTDAAASSRSVCLTLLDLRVLFASACYTDATWGFGFCLQASSGLAKSRKASDSKLDYSDITVRPAAPSCAAYSHSLTCCPIP